jgi:hypothetical protein
MSVNETERSAPSDAASDEPSDSARGGEELLRALTRLKLRIEVCLRRERDRDEYKAAMARCLDDVDQVVRAASMVVARHASRRL